MAKEMGRSESWIEEQVDEYKSVAKAYIIN